VQPAEAAGGVAGAVFDFGPLGRLPVYKGTHPTVMDTCIAGMDWRDGLRLVDPPVVRRGFHKDERFKYRILSAIERGTGLDLNHRSYRRVLKV